MSLFNDKDVFMPHSIPLITMLATAFGLALLLGFLAARLKLPVLVGYLLAGIIIGPHTPGYVASSELASELAEIGVMLLMFGVGLHFSLSDLMEVRKIALPGAVLQIVVATFLGTWIARLWGWPMGGALIFGLSLSVASTVVLLRALEAHNLLESISGRIAVGWLVVEDLVMVMVIVLLPPLASWLNAPTQGGQAAHLTQALGLTFIKISIFIALVMVVGRKIFPKILWQITRSGSRELFTLCVVATAITIAFVAAKLFGVSFALGAFFAGMMMRESPLSHRAAEESLPLREAFAVLFFVSVGMLFDPMILVHHPMKVLIVVGIIMLGKTIAAAVLVLCFRYALSTAILVSVSLAQIGEFSFILSGLGVGLGLLSQTGQSLILAGALISIALNPLLFKIAEPSLDFLTSRFRLARKLQSPMTSLTTLPMGTGEEYLADQVVLVGYGRLGSRIGEVLLKHNIPYVVAEQNREIVEDLRERKISAVFGDAAEPDVLVQAHVFRANMLVITIDDIFNVRQMIETARTLNPKTEILVCVHSEEERDLLAHEMVAKVFYSEEEFANNITHHVLNRYGQGADS